MAKLRFWARQLTGTNLYAHITNTSAEIWNGTAYEAVVAANIATYAITLTEHDGFGLFSADVPDLPEGLADVPIFQRAGGSPATTDEQVGVGTLDWSGSAERTLLTDTQIEDAVWDAATTDHTTAGTFGLLLQTINTAIAALSSAAAIAAAVWAYATRTLTSSAAATAATVEGDNITITRGDTASISITGLGSIADRSTLWFTVKKQEREADTRATIQITESGGLLRLNGSTTTSGNGSITVDSAASGDVTIAIDEAATAELDPGQYIYDIQVLRSGGSVGTLTSGKFIVSADVTRSIS